MLVNIRFKNGEYIKGATIPLDDILDVIRYANRNPFVLVEGGEQGEMPMVQSFSTIDFIEAAE